MIIGFNKGKMININNWILLHPSKYPASSREIGIPLIKPWNKKVDKLTPKPAYIKINPPTLSNPRKDINFTNGNIKDWKGINIDAIKKKKSTVDVFVLTRTNTQAAIAEIIIIIDTEVTVISKDTKKAWVKLTVLYPSIIYLGVHTEGNLMVSVKISLRLASNSGLKELTKIKYSGDAKINANKEVTTKIINNFIFFLFIRIQSPSFYCNKPEPV